VVSLNKVEIPLFSVVSEDALQQKLQMSDLEKRNEAARKELDDLLADGWTVITSAVYVTPPANQVLVMVLYKDERRQLMDIAPMIDAGLGMYLHPVYDEGD
jgi:hypothetical protein